MGRGHTTDAPAHDADMFFFGVIFHFLNNSFFGVGHNMGHFEPIYFDQKIKSVITNN